MTWTAFGLLFASVFLHALWHFLSKSRKPIPAFFLLVSFSDLLFTLPFFCFVAGNVSWSALPAPFWWLLVGGGLSGMLCDLGLSAAYRRADISLAYPLARALPVLLTVPLTLLFGLGRAPGAAALVGMVLIFIGCLLMPMTDFRQFRLANYRGAAMLGIVIAAAGTTGYTIFDSQALRLMMETGAGRISGTLCYMFCRECMISGSLAFFVFLRPAERARITPSLFRQPYPYCAGVFAACAYLLVLLAMGFVSNVAYVQAFRQMSLPVGVLLGILVLHERCHAPEWVGLALLFVGLCLAGF